MILILHFIIGSQIVYNGFTDIHPSVFKDIFLKSFLIKNVLVKWFNKLIEYTKYRVIVQ